MIGLRACDELRKKIDSWATRQADGPGRSEAIRRLVELGLSASTGTSKHSSKPASKAADMADDEIERVEYHAAPSDERAKRKRRLIKGPTEFREMRRDQPKAKR